MTPNEAKLVRSVLKPFADSGLLSLETLEEIVALKDKDKPKNRPNLITREDLVEMLKVSRQSVYNWEKAGKLKAIKLAGCRMIRYKMEDVESLLQS